MLSRAVFSCVLLCTVTALPVNGQQKFSQLVGPVNVRPVQNTKTLKVPFITWGGDVATFYANGGLKTASGSLMAKQGLNLQLTPGDDFLAQVRDYMSGKTPFLRGTYRMLGQASEVLGSTPATKPVIVMQLSWSAGDHLVAREGLKTLNDLKRSGKKVRIACQQGGPHVGLLFDSLAAAQIKRNEVDIAWVADLSGDQGPAELFRNDKSIDACCVITPDMLGLCGDGVGTGAEGTVEGAHVLNSTAQMSRSIADVYAVRSDWFKANRATVEKFVACYLAGTEATVKMRDNFEKSGRMQNDYRQLLTTAQKTFGAEVLPTLEVDAHGLLLDCGFVGLPGQIAFFEDKGNLSGFESTMKKSLDMAVGWGYASSRSGFDPPKFDYRSIAKLANIAYVKPTKSGGRIAAETLDFSPEAELDDRTIVSFTISFDPNQASFSSDRYGAEFNRAIQSASTFGNTVVVIRGHSDPTQTLRELISAGVKKNIIKRTGARGSYKYFLDGRPMDVDSISKMVNLIKAGKFEGTNHKPRETMQAALNLSLARAEAVKSSLIDHAKQQQVNLDASQMQPVGAGIMEPVVPKPKNLEEAKENMRVEFRIVRVPAEAIQDSDFDF